MRLCTEFLFAKRYDFGCNFCFASLKQVTPKIVPFSVSVLAVVTSKVEIAMCTYAYAHAHMHAHACIVVPVNPTALVSGQVDPVS